MNYKTDRRVTRTIYDIRHATLDIMARKKKKIEEVTITEVCEQAHINRKTFYAHYGNVYEVIEEIESELLEAFTKDLSPYISDEKSDFTSFEFHHLSSLIKSDFTFYSNLINLDNSLSLFPKNIKTLKEIVIHYYCDTLGYNCEFISPLADFILGGVISSYSAWFNSDHSTSLEDLSKNISYMIISCIKTATSHVLNMSITHNI